MDHQTYLKHRKLLERDHDRSIGNYHHGSSPPGTLAGKPTRKA